MYTNINLHSWRMMQFLPLLQIMLIILLSPLLPKNYSTSYFCYLLKPTTFKQKFNSWFPLALSISLYIWIRREFGRAKPFHNFPSLVLKFRSASLYILILLSTHWLWHRNPVSGLLLLYIYRNYIRNIQYLIAHTYDSLWLQINTLYVTFSEVPKRDKESIPIGLTFQNIESSVKMGFKYLNPLSACWKFSVNFYLWEF